MWKIRNVWSDEDNSVVWKIYRLIEPRNRDYESNRVYYDGTFATRSEARKAILQITSNGVDI